MKRLKAIVTGGVGFIGQHLVKELLEEGIDVLVLDIQDFDRVQRQQVRDKTTPKEETPPGKLFFKIVDVCQADEVNKAIEDYKPNLVFHLAAMSRVNDCQDNPGKANDVNVGGSFNVLLAAARHGVERIVMASTSAVYGNNANCIKYQLEPMGVYGKTKLAMEGIAASLASEKFEVNLCRLFNVYGPSGESVVDKFIHAAKNKMPLTINGDGNQQRDFIHVQDVVEAFLALTFKVFINRADPLQVWNVGTGQSFSVLDVANMVDPHDCLGVHWREKPTHEPPKTQAILGDKWEGIWQPNFYLPTYVEKELT